MRAHGGKIRRKSQNGQGLFNKIENCKKHVSKHRHMLIDEQRIRAKTTNENQRKSQNGS